jgi:signal transduction histidine kinase
LSDVFGSLLDAVRAELEHRGQPQIEMTTDFEVDEIVADPEQLRQVGLNLVTNAVQSMEQGGRLTVSSRRSDDGSVQIAISDTGKGIEPDLLGRLFEPFVSGRPGGTGLGLAIVKKIVDQHGGRIDVSSQPVQGTTFTITLPAGSPQALGIAR